MGLDNGIVLVTKNKNILEEIPPYVTLEKDDGNENKNGFCQYDVCYWRKCYCLRDSILEFTSINKYNSIDKYNDSTDYELKIDDLATIISILTDYLIHPEKWDSAIWDFEDMISHIAQDIVNLSWLRDYLTSSDSKGYCYFYDSY